MTAVTCRSSSIVVFDVSLLDSNTCCPQGACRPFFFLHESGFIVLVWQHQTLLFYVNDSPYVMFLLRSGTVHMIMIFLFLFLFLFSQFLAWPHVLVIILLRLCSFVFFSSFFDLYIRDELLIVPSINVRPSIFPCFPVPLPKTTYA